MLLRLKLIHTQNRTEIVCLNEHTLHNRISTVFYCLIHSGGENTNLKYYNRKSKIYFANCGKQRFSEVPTFTSSAHMPTYPNVSVIWPCMHKGIAKNKHKRNKNLILNGKRTAKLHRESWAAFLPVLPSHELVMLKSLNW